MILLLPVRLPPVTVGLAHLLPWTTHPWRKRSAFSAGIINCTNTIPLTGAPRHTQPHTLSLNTHTSLHLLPFTFSAAPHPLSLRIPFFAPSIIYHSKRTPPPTHRVLHCLLSLPIPKLLLPSSPISSFSPALVPSPGRLQMVLNGRRTECNCFVNNSTDTR